MQIAYEGLIYEMMPTGGIARYFEELITHLPEDCNPHLLIPEAFRVKATHPNLKTHYAKVKPPFHSAFTKKLLARYWRKSRWGKIEASFAGISADVRHWTYYCGLCQRPIPRSQIPNVITVYDFIAEHHPEIDPRGKHRQWLQQATTVADHVICISETTHNELCNRYPSAAEKTSIIPLGNSFKEIESAELPEQLRNQDYLLFVGRRNEYKNFSVLWKAWKTVKTLYPGLLLAAAGPPVSDRECQTLAISRDESGFVPLGPVSDGTLKTLYAKSKAFVFPSRMEGFGLPALEAMESGSIVLASDCAALKEVCGDAARYFHPDDETRLAELIDWVMNLPVTERLTAMQLGKRRASSFSWEQVAKKTTQVYQTVIANHSGTA